MGHVVYADQSQAYAVKLILFHWNTFACFRLIISQMVTAFVIAGPLAIITRLTLFSSELNANLTRLKILEPVFTCNRTQKRNEAAVRRSREILTDESGRPKKRQTCKH